MKTTEKNSVLLVNLEAENQFQEPPFYRYYLQRALSLSNVNPLETLPPLVLDWSLIFCAILASELVQFWPLTICCLLLIGTRQHALMVLVHEGAHVRLWPNKKMNDLISNFFAAYPTFFCTEAYRLHHAHHHRFLNTEKDPDWARKSQLKEWQFPKTKPQLLKLIPTIVATSWLRLLVLFGMMSGLWPLNRLHDPENRRRVFQKALFYTATAVGLTLFKTWAEFALYWLTPYFLVMPLIERVRSLSEHFGLERTHWLNQTRDILAPNWESFLFGPHNINYHLVHHLYPMIPQAQLPTFRKELMENEDFRRLAHTNDTYFFAGKKSVLDDLTRTPESQESKKAQSAA